jgi:hypothetical protein
MSRTYKDRPYWVKRNDRSRPGRDRHSHNEWIGWKNRSQTGECTISEEVTRENVHDLTCYWEPFDQFGGCCNCGKGIPWAELPRRVSERDVMLQYKKEYNSGEEELSFEDDVFSTNKRHDYDTWWYC